MKMQWQSCLQRHESRSGGIALIAVLWLLALLTLLGASVATLSMSQRRAAERYIQVAQAESVADSAIRLTFLKLFTATRSGAAWPVGQSQTVELLGAVAEVVVEREAARLDLNTVAPELLFAVFAANGWSEDDARSMAARIVDWRDTDDLQEESGAEQSAYTGMGLAYGPRNRPFESIDELRQVMGSEGIDGELFGAFTVYTHTQAPIAGGASTAAGRALIYANDRQLGGHRWLSPGQEQGQGIPPAADSSLTGEVVRIQSCVSLHGMRLCREAIVRLTGSAQRPLQVFAWQTQSSTNY